MSWETRQRGGRYYTRTRRVNGRCVREYLGCGVEGALSAQADTEDREAREQARRAHQEALQAFDSAGEDLDHLDASADLAEALLLSAAGFHEHKGEWRYKRVSTYRTE